jgi:hypothetical protein
MAKKVSENKEVSEQSEPLTSNEEVLIEVQALRQVNTSKYGNIPEGKKGKIGFELAEQLAALGEVKIL